MHAAVAEGGGQALQRLGGLGQQADAAHRAVQPVGEAQEDLAGLAVPLRDEGLVGLRQRLVARLVALRDLAHALAHHQQVVVLIQDPPLQILELRFAQFPVFHTAKIAFSSHPAALPLSSFIGFHFSVIRRPRPFVIRRRRQGCARPSK